MVNFLIPVVPCLLIFAIWGRSSALLMMPSAVAVAVYLVGQIIPDDFAVLPRTGAGAEVGFYGVIAFFVIALGLYLWFLAARQFDWRTIAFSQLLQAPAWVFTWFVVASILGGGK